MSRYARRVDSTHAEIADTLRALGYTVHDTHVNGRGFVDLVAGRNGLTVLVEAVGVADWPKAVAEHEKRRLGWKGGPWIIVKDRDDLLSQLAAVEWRAYA